MKLTRIIATIGLFLSRFISVIYFATALHLLASVIFKLPTFKLLPSNIFIILYPFSAKTFLIGSVFSAGYIAEMVLIILFYGSFFWLLSNVFKTFRKKKLFTVQGIKNLKLFYIINLFISPVLFTILSIYSIEDYPYFAIIIGHVILGVLVFFIAAIFEQGVNLQHDQDLFI
ncbi:MAG: hypothetical protein ABI297_09430 [Ginsengibacter sp.]